MKRITLLSLLAALSFSATAEKLAIINAKAHTMTEAGVLENATVLISNGKIQALLEQTPALAGYTVIDAKGQPLTPGLMGAYTSLGLVEVGMSAGTVDSRYEPEALSKVGAALDVSYGVNPFSTLMGISRIDGVTSAATTMSSTEQMFKGQGAIISLADGYKPIIKARAFVSTAVDNHGSDDLGGSRAALWVSMQQVLSEVQYAKGKTLNPDTLWQGLTSKADVKALEKVLNGEVPLLITARRAADIMQVIELKSRYNKLNIVLLYATEGWRVAQEIAKANIPVILDPESNLPYEFDQLAATLANAGRLHQAGVLVAIGMDTHNIRLARQQAGNAVANGLPWEAGLASITRNPAIIYGVDQQMGAIAPGMRADLVLWTGDPLQVTEDAQQVFINGEAIKMESRQTQLRDRYLNRKEGISVHHIRP